MQFKPENEKRLKNEWNDAKLTPLLKQIVEDAADHAKKNWNWDFVVTSIYRTPAEDQALKASGIHVEWRAVDVRTKDRDPQEVNSLADYVNDKWIYDPKRKGLKVCFKELHGNGVHAHFQIHPNTKMRNGQKPAAATPQKDSAAPASFKGEAAPLDESGLLEIVEDLGVRAAELWAVIDVETYGYGYLPDRRPLILFERHWFSKFTDRKHDAAHPDISNKKAGGYKGKAAEYERLNRAGALDRTAALKSASWGIGQVMGFNHKIAGYGDAEEMIAAMTLSENDQLGAMVNFMISNKLHVALKAHDWKTFARGYNGANYHINNYDTRLAAAYNKRKILLPDLTVRAAQVYLTYLGFKPGKIDGVSGKLTVSALNEFQAQNNLPIENEIDEKLLAVLKEKVLS